LKDVLGHSLEETALTMGTTVMAVKAALVRGRGRGKQVGAYFGRYEKENVALRVVLLEGRLAFAAYVGGAERPAYFILLEFEEGRVMSIRDFRYVPYIAAEAEFELV
jgi:hypothetical protein